MTYSYFCNDDQITLINLTNGNRVTMYNDDARFTTFKGFIVAGEYASAEMMDNKVAVQNFAASFSGSDTFSIEIADGIGSVNVKGATYPLADVIVKRIIKMVGEGFDAQPLVNFLCNLYDNPSKTAIDELFLFMQPSQLPITQDGCIVAYKIVKEDYFDIYSGKFDNSVGKVVEMPRFAVDDNRSNTCSAGLHFCSKGYLPHYGAGNGTRCMLVKINPKDIVSIPNDYSNAKGRTCRYEVIGEVTTDEWRQFLADRDYNTRSVVNDDGSECDYPVDDDNEGWNEDDLDREDILWDQLGVLGYYFDCGIERWRNAKGEFVPVWRVAANVGATEDEICNLVN